MRNVSSGGVAACLLTGILAAHAVSADANHGHALTSSLVANDELARMLLLASCAPKTPLSPSPLPAELGAITNRAPRTPWALDRRFEKTVAIDHHLP